MAERFWQYFDRIVVINLPERKDRRRAIVRELKRHGLDLEPDRVEIFPAIRPDEAGGFPSVGARGCFLSHLEVLRQARDKGLGNVLIMEDDLRITPRLDSSQDLLVEALELHSWAFAYFGHVLDLLDTSAVTMTPYSGPVVLTHFFAVNGPALAPLVDFLETVLQRPPGHPDGGPMHVDGAYSTFREQNPELLTLVAQPSLGNQRSSISDITPASWIHGSWILRSVVGLFHTIKNWVAMR